MFRTRNGDIRLSYVFCLFFVNIIFLFTFLKTWLSVMLIGSSHFRKLTLIEIIKH